MATSNNVPSGVAKDAKAFGRGKFGAVVGVIGGGIEMVQRVGQGENLPSALVKTVASNALYNVAPWLLGAQLGMAAGQLIGTGIPAAATSLQGIVGAARNAAFTSQFNDTSAAQTMRMRGVQSIQRSMMNSRSFLGQEARAMRRGY